VAVGAQAGVEHLHDRAGDVVGDFLDKARDFRFRGQDEFAFVWRFLAGDDPHQAGLACAVAPEQTDALARLDLKIDVVEQRRGAVLKCDLAELQ